MSGIARIDYDPQHAHGFRAALFDATGSERRKACGWPTKFFADLKHGGRDRAREACHRWIDAARRELARHGIATYQGAVRDKGRVRRILAAMKAEPIARAR